MSISNRRLLCTLMIGVLLVTVAGRALDSNDSGREQIIKDGVSIKVEQNVRQNTGPSIRQFARHGLCNHRFGKVRFFKALRQHFHNISDDMKITFVLDICKRRDQMLTKWVQEIFDKDSDGYITHFEQEIYR